MSETLYEVIVQRDVMATMRDGVRLAADIYLPAQNGEPLPGKHPALLHRTQYDKTAVERGIGWCRWFAERGYVAILQDSRGTFESEGVTNFFIPEAEDGFDTLEWIGRQTWSNGQVGNWGISWAGWTQTAMAALGPPNQGTLVPTFSGSNAYTSTIRQGGAFELRLMGAAFWVSAFNRNRGLKQEPFVDPALNLSPVRISDWLTRLPIRRGQTQLSLVPNYEDWLLEIMTRSDYDEYWKHPSFAPEEHWDNFPDWPMLFVGGWYDPYTRAVFENFLGLSALKKGPVRVLIGPWTHANDSPERVYAGDAEFGGEAAVDFKETHRRWFDQWMRGVENGVREEAPIRLFVMGGGEGYRTLSGRLMHGGRWRDEHEWPLARTQFTPFYIHADGSLDASVQSETESSTTYTFDPEDPVPTIGGQLSAFYELTDLPPGIADPAVLPRQARVRDIVAAGGYDQTEDPRFFGCSPPFLPLGSRRDVLVYQTEPLAEDVEVTGPIEVVLWVSSSAPDTDFTAKLIDSYPPNMHYPYGFNLNLTDSIIRLRYRHGDGKADPLPPGEVACIKIILLPTSNLFAAGHRIRLDISSSNFPRFDANPNTGEPLLQHRRKAPADNTVFHDALRPSHVLLPVIPR